MKKKAFIIIFAMLISLIPAAGENFLSPSTTDEDGKVIPGYEFDPLRKTFELSPEIYSYVWLGIENRPFDGGNRIIKSIREMKLEPVQDVDGGTSWVLSSPIYLNWHISHLKPAKTISIKASDLTADGEKDFFYSTVLSLKRNPDNCSRPKAAGLNGSERKYSKIEIDVKHLYDSIALDLEVQAKGKGKRNPMKDYTGTITVWFRIG